jgi:hypothetical protein
MGLLGRLERFERLEPFERAASAASPTSMIGKILPQPFVPGAVDLADSAQLRISAIDALHQRYDPEVDAGQMGIGAEVIADHHYAFRFQLRKRLLHLLSAYIRAPKDHGQLGHKARFLHSMTQHIDNGFPNAAWVYIRLFVHRLDLFIDSDRNGQSSILYSQSSTVQHSITPQLQHSIPYLSLHLVSKLFGNLLGNAIVGNLIESHLSIRELARGLERFDDLVDALVGWDTVAADRFSVNNVRIFSDVPI